MGTQAPADQPAAAVGCGSGQREGSPLVSAKTRVAGVIGYPISHSLSPPMHNAGFAALGLDWVYLAFAVPPPELPAAVAGARALGLAGFNVTVPHKERVLPLLDELDPLAARIGAVNTVVSAGGRLTGYNTDASGFLTALREAGFEPAGRRAVILGAGGAARAAAFALAAAGAAAVTVANRTPGRAAALAADLQGWRPSFPARGTGLAPDDLASALESAELLVQTTSAGMNPAADTSPITGFDLLRPGLWVYDLVYSPAETLLMRQALARGGRVLGGAAMLLYQGTAAFRLFTGLEPPVAAMRTALEARLGK